MDELKHHVGNLGYKSEFNMGQLDFIRFDTILRRADDLQCQAILFKKEAILQYYAVVRNLYNNIRPLLMQNKKLKLVKQYNETFDTLYTKVMEWYSLKNKPFPVRLYKVIEIMHGDLLTLRQSIGLGIVMERKYADKTVIRKGLGVSKIKFG